MSTKPKPKVRRPRTAEGPQQRVAGGGSRRRRSSTMGIGIKLLMVAMVSAVIGAMFMAMAGVWLAESSLTSGFEAEIMLAVFILAFAISAISIGRQVLARHRMGPAKPRSDPGPIPAPKAARKRLIGHLQNGPSLPGVLPSEETDKDNEAKEGEANKEEANKEEVPSFDSPDVEAQYRLAMKFLGDGMAIVEANHDLQSNFNKFGINLFLAGGCDLLSQRHGLDQKAKSSILGEAVISLGFKKEGAYGFAENCQDYLLADFRYMHMFQSGRNAMSTYLADQALIGRHLDDALNEWNEPKKKDDKAGPITVMFTDMVGSTALTQTTGDAAAQEVVRTHNRFVRDALTAFNGKEIKHTGDGIMASFTNTSSAVEAAMVIQKKTAAHNDDNSHSPLHLKIGINVGEPIVEDDDLFGATVQLSARIVDKAQAEQIFVSETVKGICTGKGIRFFNRGNFAVKGFEDDITLHEVIWDDNVSVGELKEKAALELENELGKTIKRKMKEEEKEEEEPVAEEQAALTTEQPPEKEETKEAASTVEQQVEPRPATVAPRKAPQVAEQGEATVQYTQGLWCSLGLGVPQDDRQAAKWYRLAAEQGHAGAQSNLAEMHDKGRGVPRDNKEAAKWYRLAAEQGHAGAQSNLAEMYDKGRGVPQDNEEAAKWYRLAAEQGDGDAQANMGVMHVYGRGVPKDYVLAHMWWDIAASRGDEEARKYRDQIENRMSSADLSKARKLAQEWMGEPGLDP